MPHPNHVVPKPPIVSDNLMVSFKLGALISLVFGLVGGTWWAATEWTNLQNRLNTIGVADLCHQGTFLAGTNADQTRC
jgi:hypothetical protein